MQLRLHRPWAGSSAQPAQIRGFSLVEVLVALVVLGVGLLGIAKLEGASFSNTSTAARRSLAAIEADSLAAAMHVNRGYWSGADPSGAVITATGSSVTVTTGAALLAAAVTTAQSCTVAATPCPPVNMAAYDLAQWAQWGLRPVLQNYTATISCGTVTPVSCTVNITWIENAVAVNSQEASAASAAAASAVPATNFANPSYTLYVQP